MSGPFEGEGSKFYRAGVCMVALTVFLTVWTTIVRDDNTGESYFMLLLAIGVGAFATRLSAEGLARTLAGVAVMQVLLGMLIATAPITATRPPGPLWAFGFNCVFALLWLGAAALFRSAARQRARA